MKKLSSILLFAFSVLLSNQIKADPSHFIYDKVNRFFSDQSTPENLLRIRQIWGIENMFQMYDHYETQFHNGHYISTYSRLIEDSFKIAGVAYDFFGYSVPYAVPLSLIYWGYYLTPGFFYRAANFAYSAVDGNAADLPLDTFRFNKNNTAHSAFLKCEYYTSEKEIKSNNRPSSSNFVRKKDIPVKLQSLFIYSRNFLDGEELVTVPGRWLRLSRKNDSFNYAAFGTLANAGILESACAFAGISAGYANLETLVPVITVENNSWVGSYPVFFYIEGLKKNGDHDIKIAAKLIAADAKNSENKDCICECDNKTKPSKK